jgi:uncharacterized membrane protein YkoI
MALANKVLIPGIAALAVVVGLAGGSILNGSPANAATATTTPTSTTSTTAAPVDTDNVQDESQGGHKGANGTTETVLTGADADTAKAAALKAEPGGTVQRVENDAEGAAYEAHVTKSDGSEVTVKLDANFNVVGTESGHGKPGN